MIFRQHGVHDVDSLEPGIDFVQELERRVKASEAMLVMIGEEWAAVTDANGRPRLHDEHDFVRLKSNRRSKPTAVSFPS